MNLRMHAKLVSPPGQQLVTSHQTQFSCILGTRVICIITGFLQVVENM